MMKRPNYHAPAFFLVKVFRVGRFYHVFLHQKNYHTLVHFRFEHLAGSMGHQTENSAKRALKLAIKALGKHRKR